MIKPVYMVSNESKESIYKKHRENEDIFKRLCNVEGDETIPLIDKCLDNLPNSIKIVDLGCGSGKHVNRYLQKGYDVVGLDFVFEGLL